MNKIAFQGLPGAYSHLACRTAYPDHDPLPCLSFETAMAAVRDGSLPSLRVGRRILIPRRQLEALLDGSPPQR